MRAQELRGLPVIDPRSARRVGTVCDIQVDPIESRLMALDIEPAGGDAATPRERILAEHVRRVGKNAVMLRGAYMPVLASELRVDESWLDLDTIGGLEVMGDGGDRLGNLADVCFDPESLRVDAWELAVSGVERWFGGGGKISTDAVLSCSRELMLVEAGHRGTQLATSDEVIEPRGEEPAPARH